MRKTTLSFKIWFKNIVFYVSIMEYLRRKTRKTLFLNQILNYVILLSRRINARNGWSGCKELLFNRKKMSYMGIISGNGQYA